MSSGYWPWWLGAIGLGGITLAYFRLLGRPFGVTSAWSRVVFAREEIDVAREEARIGDDAKAMEDALLAATLEEFGPAAEEAMRKELASSTADGTTPRAELAKRPAWTESLVLLGGIFVGGFLAALSSRSFGVRTDLGPEFSRIFGDGFFGVAALFLGGGLVGFGTTMAGGCTSGHGLSGCSRLQPGSLVSTCVFLGAAIGAAFAMEAIAR